MSAIISGLEVQEFIKAFKARETVPKKERKRVPKNDELPQFLNGRSLRDYQVRCHCMA